jgi:hypothetical protein
MRATHAVFAIAAAIAVGTTTLPAQVLQGSQAATALVPKSGADSAYLTRIALLQGGDTTADLSALRRQFAQTTFYHPYSTTADDLRHRMWKHLNDKDAAGAGAAADSLLAENYFDADAQMVAGMAAGERDDTVAAVRHITIARGIIRSIESTGDGRTSDHAMFVLSPSEEYSYLAANDLRRVGRQALVECAGHACDVLEVAPSGGGKHFDLFFDVSLPMAYLDRQFKPASKPK